MMNPPQDWRAKKGMDGNLLIQAFAKCTVVFIDGFLYASGAILAAKAFGVI